MLEAIGEVVIDTMYDHMVVGFTSTYAIIANHP